MTAAEDIRSHLHLLLNLALRRSAMYGGMTRSQL